MNEDQQLPLVHRLPDSVSALAAFQQFARLPHVIYFDSAATNPAIGRYSFVAADPFAWFEGALPCRSPGALTEGGRAAARAASAAGDPFSRFTSFFQRFHTPCRPDLPPFQGGLAGLCGYDLCQQLEPVPAAEYDDLPTPAMALGAYDVVAAFDHVEGKGWLISQGFPELDPAARRERAAARMAQFEQLLAGAFPELPDLYRPADHSQILAPRFDVGRGGIESNMSADDYRRMIVRAVDYIRAGDVFQVNLAQRLLFPAAASSVELYLRLRARNPAPYASYFDLGESQVVSASPECFLTVRSRQVETRPIKGTRGRLLSPEADLFAADDLKASEKDRAENVMIVDLMRNDLSRVCRPESVHIAQLCRLETYAYVQHLVSVVRGELEPDCSPIDLLKASFPGGSVTGAPKVRAMQIIAELEPTARGPYCGSLAYFGFDGSMDANILIRTITAAHGWWQMPVGGGIVAQSDPDEEYRETWHKARGLLKAII